MLFIHQDYYQHFDTCSECGCSSCIYYISEHEERQTLIVTLHRK